MLRGVALGSGLLERGKTGLSQELSYAVCVCVLVVEVCVCVCGVGVCVCGGGGGVCVGGGVRCEGAVARKSVV